MRRERAHDVLRLRDVLALAAADSPVLQFAYEQGCVLVTCNRDDFIELAQHHPHHGIVVIIRRRTRAAEHAAANPEPSAN